MSRQYNEKLIAGMHHATHSETWTAEKNLAFFQRVIAGDVVAREQMIVGNMPLAVSKVESFIRCSPRVGHLRDDLTSAAFVGLVKAVNQMVEGCEIKQPESWNPTDCIGSWINRELSRLLEDEKPIHVPHESNRLAKQKGDPITIPEVHNTIPERFEVPSYENELEARDLLDACCAGDNDRTFVVMREAGHTLSEIAVVTKMSVASVHRRGKALDARVQCKVKALLDE